MKSDYYVAVGICYNDRYEFPEKKFYWCNQANNMTFEQFPKLHENHKEANEAIANQLFEGEPMKVHKVLVDPEEEAKKKAEKQAKMAQATELDDTEEEDPESLIEKVDFKEIDRLHHHVLAIENDCHIIPQGAMKLTIKHEVQRNEAFNGLTQEEAFRLGSYSHFRNVQDPEKKRSLEADDAIFQRDFLDEVESDKPLGCWSV